MFLFKMLLKENFFIIRKVSSLDIGKLGLKHGKEFYFFFFLAEQWFIGASIIRPSWCFVRI